MFKHAITQSLAMVLVVGSCFAENYTRERYEIIIRRAPFSSEPLDLDSTGVSRMSGEKDFPGALRLCFLIESEGGTRKAGFENMQVRPGESKIFILAEGESFRGVRLEKIDVDHLNAVFSQNSDIFLFEMANAPEPPPPAPTRLVPLP